MEGVARNFLALSSGPNILYEPIQKVVTLSIAQVQHSDGRRYRAFKSDETEIEVLRTIIGFVENVL